MKSKVELAPAVPSGLIEGGGGRVGAHSGGGGRGARPLEMGHRHTGHDVFLWSLNHDEEELSIHAQICSLGTNSLFLKPDLLAVCHLGSSRDLVALEIRSSIPEYLKLSSRDLEGDRRHRWFLGGWQGLVPEPQHGPVRAHREQSYNTSLGVEGGSLWCLALWPGRWSLRY